MNVKIPARAFFNFAFACPYRSEDPTVDGDLGDWDENSRIPDLTSIEGKQPFADLYMAWSNAGLFFAVHVRKAPALKVQPARPLRGDGLQLWVDTRDVRDAHRASRYCHHFYFLPTGGGKGGRRPLGGQVRIRRARAHAKVCDSGQLQVASRVSRSNYRMEIHLPASVLTGFDPEENRRLGFTYLLRDRKLGRQFLTMDETLPVSVDPSLWATVELAR